MGALLFTVFSLSLFLLIFSLSLSQKSLYLFTISPSTFELVPLDGTHLSSTPLRQTTPLPFEKKTGLACNLSIQYY